MFTHTHTCRAFLNEAMVSSSCLFLDVWLWHKFPSFIQFKTSKVYSFKVVCNTCTKKKKKKKLICELSVQCELHNDFIVNTVDNSNLFWWLHCWQCHFNWQSCLLFQWIWPIYGSNCSAISGCRIERSFSARFFSCKSPLVSSLFQRSIRRYVFSTVSLYSFSISW